MVRVDAIHLHATFGLGDLVVELDWLVGGGASFVCADLDVSEPARVFRTQLSRSSGSETSL